MSTTTKEINKDIAKLLKKINYNTIKKAVLERNGLNREGKLEFSYDLDYFTNYTNSEMMEDWEQFDRIEDRYLDFFECSQVICDEFDEGTLVSQKKLDDFCLQEEKIVEKMVEQDILLEIESIQQAINQLLKDFKCEEIKQELLGQLHSINYLLDVSLKYIINDDIADEAQFIRLQNRYPDFFEYNQTISAANRSDTDLVSDETLKSFKEQESLIIKKMVMEDTKEGVK